ncbi:DMT family transporter [Algihabitans albus]|uniref:DMT family transporter n=1 Tax=Algihabitans albus TaxID=2164067 RepID=UPI0013C2F493|nr:DMT family transporter [Algihabitans albus]
MSLRLAFAGGRRPLSDGTAALIAVAFGAAMTGFAPIFARLSELGAIPTAFHRMAFASLALCLLMALLPAPAERRPAKLIDLLLLVAAGLFFAGDLGFFHAALANTSVANATLLVNLAPILVGLGAWALFGERPSLRYLGGMLLAVGGALWLSMAGARSAETGLTGDLQAVAAAGFYAAYLLTLKRLRAVFTTAALMFWSSAAAASALLAIALVMGDPLLPDSLRGWAAVAALGLIGHALGQGLVARGLKQLPVAYSALVLLLQPLVATAAAWAVFGEALLLGQLAGGLLLLAGLAVARPRK